MNRKLVCVLFVLVAAGAGCTINGKPLLGFGAKSPALAGGGGGGGGGDGGGGAGDDGGGPAAEAAPLPYAWCKNLREDSGEDDAKEALDPETHPGRAVPAISQALCYPREGARGKRDALEAMRRTWMQRFQIDDNDWATDIVAWGNLGYGDRMSIPGHVFYPKQEVAWSAAGPLEQWAIVNTQFGNSTSFYYYAADALALTEAGRLALIEKCTRGDEHHPEPTAWAVCQADVEALDLRKLAAEIRGETQRSLAERMAVRFRIMQMQQRLPAHAERVKRLLSTDPVYAKLFEIAKNARKEWRDRAASRSTQLAAVRAMDDVRATDSLPALKGCSARTWSLFADAVSKIPAKRFENLRPDSNSKQRTTFAQEAIGAILENPEAYLAANALFACESRGDQLVRRLGSEMSHWPGFRGPRTAALTAIRLANLKPKDPEESIMFPLVHHPLMIVRDSPVHAHGGGTATGVVATVTEEERVVRVTFPKTSALDETCVAHRQTHRISRIDSQGHVYYERICTRWKPVRVDTTLDPVVVPKRYAAGLAPKRYISVVDGIPEAAWATAKSPTPLAVFGVLLK